MKPSGKSWSGAFYLGVGTVLNISGTSPLDRRHIVDVDQFFKPPFLAVGGYISQSLIKDAVEHFELAAPAEDNQLELF